MAKTSTRAARKRRAPGTRAGSSFTVRIDEARDLADLQALVAHVNRGGRVTLRFDGARWSLALV